MLKLTDDVTDEVLEALGFMKMRTGGFIYDWRTYDKVESSVAIDENRNVVVYVSNDFKWDDVCYAGMIDNEYVLSDTEVKENLICDEFVYNLDIIFNISCIINFHRLLLY